MSDPPHITHSHLIHCYYKNIDYSCFNSTFYILNCTKVCVRHQQKMHVWIWISHKKYWIIFAFFNLQSSVQFGLLWSDYINDPCDCAVCVCDGCDQLTACECVYVCVCVCVKYDVHVSSDESRQSHNVFLQTQCVWTMRPWANEFTHSHTHAHTHVTGAY